MRAPVNSCNCQPGHTSSTPRCAPNDHESETEAVKAYNDGIRLCTELGDNGTRELLEDNLEDEEAHIDWLESQLDQIEQMGLPNYLLSQTE